jgi:hypothetical protein
MTIEIQQNKTIAYFKSCSPQSSYTNESSMYKVREHMSIRYLEKLSADKIFYLAKKSIFWSYPE